MEIKPDKMPRPGTAMYIRDGQILHSDAAREAKAVKDAEEVVREVLDDPDYKLGGQMSREIRAESPREHTDVDEGVTIKRKETDGQPEMRNLGVKTGEDCRRLKEKPDETSTKSTESRPSAKFDTNHGKKSANSAKTATTYTKTVPVEVDSTKAGRTEHVVGRMKEVSKSRAVQTSGVRAEVLNQPYQREKEKWTKEQRTPEVVGVKETYTAKAEVSRSEVEVKAINAKVQGLHVDVAAEAAVKQSNVRLSAMEAHFTGVELGTVAKAEVNNTDFAVQTGCVSATGVSAKVTAEAKVNTGTAVDAGNVEAVGVGPVGVEVMADMRTGLAVGNVQCGVTGKTGVSVSTRPSLFDVNATIGPPSLAVGLGLGLGVPFMGGGGGSEGQSGVAVASASGEASRSDGQGFSENNASQTPVVCGEGGNETGSGASVSSEDRKEGDKDLRTNNRDTRGADNYPLSADGRDGHKAEYDRVQLEGQSDNKDFTSTADMGQRESNVTAPRSHMESTKTSGSASRGLSVDSENKTKVNDMRHGYWTKYTEDGDEFWVSLDDVYGSDDDLLHLYQDTEERGVASGGDLVGGDTLDRNTESGRDRHADRSMGIENKDNGNKHAYSNKGPQTRKTYGKVVGRHIHNTEEGYLPRIPQSPFLVHQDNETSYYNTAISGTKPSRKNPEGSNVKNTETKKPGASDQRNPNDPFDQLVMNMVHREVDDRLLPREKPSEQNSPSKEQRKLDREEIKASLISNLKPKVKKASDSDAGCLGGGTSAAPGGGSGMSSDSQDDQHSNKDSRPQSVKKGKPFGANKNIHGFHTLGHTSGKPLKQLGKNIVGFGN